MLHLSARIRDAKEFPHEAERSLPTLSSPDQSADVERKRTTANTRWTPETAAELYITAGAGHATCCEFVFMPGLARVATNLVPTDDDGH